MKLSDIKGERTFDVIADVIEPIANIAMDENAMAFFRREKLPEGKTIKEFMIERAKKSVPQLLKTHKKDFISILSTIKGVTEKEYTKDLNVVTLIYDCIELLSDETFSALFTSAQSENLYGSAQENTEDNKA